MDFGVDILSCTRGHFAGRLAMFSQHALSRVTFLKVVCLQTSSRDLKVIRVFTGKI